MDTFSNVHITLHFTLTQVWQIFGAFSAGSGSIGPRGTRDDSPRWLHTESCTAA